VSTQVEPHEAQAILDAVRPAAPRGAADGVEPRDFSRPLRLSGQALAAVRRALQAALPDCAHELSRTLRGEHDLGLAELGEERVEGLFDELDEPFALVRFEVGGQPAWARWDVAGAVAAVEVALGAPAPSGSERSLSGVERRLLLQLLGPLATRLGAALGLEATSGRVVASPEDAGSWADGGPGADRARLRLHLAFDGPGGASGIDLWLPGVVGQVPDDDAPPQDLPPHLDEVGVVLSARLGARDVPLAELLAIEEGDVIPLDTPVDGLLEVLAEDAPCARARLGRHGERLALRIEAVGPPPDENP
jgi:flagellar motor switch protein FliM